MALNFNPNDPKQFARLQKALKYNYREMKPFRKVRELNIEAARGHYYRTKDDVPNAFRDPVNMMDQYQQIMVRSFVQSNPRARVTSRHDPRTAQIFQEHLNMVIVELDLLDTLRKMTQEAILGYIGVVYCGVHNANVETGEPFAESIALPDFVVDLSRGSLDQADFIGHRFSRRLEELRDNDFYDQEVVEGLKAHKSGISDLEDRSSNSYDETQGSLFDWVDIWVLQIKAAGLSIYLSPEGTINKPLRIEQTDAPEFGPYVTLGFDNVPGEVMPNSRGAQLLDLHDFVNSQYRRIFMKEDQAAEFFTYEGGAEDDARQIRDALDGEMKQVNNNAAVQRRLKGGTNPQALATAIHGRQLFDEMSGQIRTLGGVGPIAETATQERIAHANTSRLVRDMQSQVTNATRKILQNLAWIEWTDPVRTRKVEIKTGKNGEALERLWSPEIREGDFIQHEIDIEPDSLEHRSSRQQLTELLKGIQQVVIPAMQMPSGRPVILKGPELVQKYSELANVPELAEVVDYALDESLVSAPKVGTINTPNEQTQSPAGGPQGGGGGGGSEEQFVQQILSGAVSGNQQDRGDAL